MVGVNRMDLQELPVGLSMALAQRPGALAHFGSLSETEQQALINRAHGVDSEQEMQELVKRMMT
jgi:hypothetical protein